MQSLLGYTLDAITSAGIQYRPVRRTSCADAHAAGGVAHRSSGVWVVGAIGTTAALGTAATVVRVKPVRIARAVVGHALAVVGGWINTITNRVAHSRILPIGAATSAVTITLALHARFLVNIINWSCSCWTRCAAVGAGETGHRRIHSRKSVTRCPHHCSTDATRRTGHNNNYY